MLPLEDLFTDVIGKAMRGLGLSNEALAQKAGVEPAALQNVMSGEVDEAIINQIAPVLNLHGPSLVEMARKAWRPEPVEQEGLAQFTTQYGDMTVNSYVVWDPATKLAAAFDTGADAKPMVNLIQNKGLNLENIFLTHTHPDHVADIPTLRTARQTVWLSVKEPRTQAPLDKQEGLAPFLVPNVTPHRIGNLRVFNRPTFGHSPGGVTYIIRGFPRQIAIVGDAVFASSMGGGGVSYADALTTNRKEIFTLPENTIICPGHGPMTTVGEEKAHNPFFPEYK